MCDRKCMFEDKSTFGSCFNGQNMPKKGQQEKIVFLHSTRAIKKHSSIRSLVICKYRD